MQKQKVCLYDAHRDYCQSFLEKNRVHCVSTLSPLAKCKVSDVPEILVTGTWGVQPHLARIHSGTTDIAQVGKYVLQHYAVDALESPRRPTVVHKWQCILDKLSSQGKKITHSQLAKLRAAEKRGNSAESGQARHILQEDLTVVV